MAQNKKPDGQTRITENKSGNWRRIRLFLVMFLIWLGIAWLLWLGVKNAPIKEKNPDEKPFEIIPASEE